jgi:hypothetical protein
MRSLLLWGLAVVAIAGYISVLVRTNEPELVDPGSVDASDLKALMPEAAMPPGYRLVAENNDRVLWGMPGEDTWRAAVAERLFEDDAGNRIAVRVVVTGMSQRRAAIGHHDALCSKAWARTDCDPQYNAYRYTAAERSIPGPEASVASFRQCYTALCGATAEQPGPLTRNESFVRAGVIVTLSVQSPDESAFGLSPGLLQALEERTSALVRSRGVDLSASAAAKR